MVPNFIVCWFYLAIRTDNLSNSHLYRCWSLCSRSPSTLNIASTLRPCRHHHHLLPAQALALDLIQNLCFCPSMKCVLRLAVGCDWFVSIQKKLFLVFQTNWFL